MFLKDMQVGTMLETLATKVLCRHAPHSAFCAGFDNVGEIGYDGLIIYI